MHIAPVDLLVRTFEIADYYWVAPIYTLGKKNRGLKYNGCLASLSLQRMCGFRYPSRRGFRMLYLIQNIVP